MRHHTNLDFKITFPLFLALALFSCQQIDKDEKNLQTPSGYPYHFLKKANNNDVLTVKPGDFIVYHETCLKNDTLWYATEKNGRPRETVYPGLDKVGNPIPPPYEAISLMSPGDCLVVYQSLREVENLPDYLKQGDELAFYISLISNVPEVAYQAQLKEAAANDSIVKINTASFLKDYQAQKSTMPLMTTSSGLQYLIKEEGAGKQVEEGNTVTVQYSGFTMDGTSFDSSYKRNKAFSFKIGSGQVIDGWDESIRLLKEGSKAIVVIPPNLAYGEKGYGRLIPPNAALVFFIHLIKVE